MLHLVQDRGGDLLLRRLRDRPLARLANEGHLVVPGLEADVAARHIVEDEEVCVLVRELLARALETALTLVGGEANEHLAGNTPLTEGSKDVGRRRELHAPRAAILWTLRRERFCRPIVGDGGGHDHDVGMRATCERPPFE